MIVNPTHFELILRIMTGEETFMENWYEKNDMLESIGLVKMVGGKGLGVLNSKLLPRIVYYFKDDSVEIRGKHWNIRIPSDALLTVMKNGRQKRDGGDEFTLFELVSNGTIPNETTLIKLESLCQIFAINESLMKRIMRRHWDGTRVEVLGVKKFALGGGERGKAGGRKKKVYADGAGDVGGVRLPYGYESIEDIWNDLVYCAHYEVAGFEDQYKLWCKVNGIRFDKTSCWKKFKELRNK